MTEQGRKNHQRQKSHIVLIQHNSDNIERLSNFINYQRLDKNARCLPLVNQTFSEQTSHQERNNYKVFTFSMINFDPREQISGEKKAGNTRTIKQKAATIFSEIFLTEKSSYFMMRSQLINCMC